MSSCFAFSCRGFYLRCEGAIAFGSHNEFCVALLHLNSSSGTICLSCSLSWVKQTRREGRRSTIALRLPPVFVQPAGIWHRAMARRACFRMPTVKDAAQIPGFVITIHDLKRHVRSSYNIPSSTIFHLRTWTNPKHGSKKRTMYLKDDQYIVDLEDAHDGRSPLVIVLKWTEPAEQRNSCRAHQKLELKDKQGRTHKQAEIDKHVCGIFRRAECDGTSCNPYDYMQNKRLRRAHE